MKVDWQIHSKPLINPNTSISLTAVHYNVQSCVKVNGNFTDWFDVKSGLKQGCILSSLFFNIFINNLVDEVKKLDVGINVNGEKIGILLLAAIM